jgi:hypothetical protein
MEDSSLRRGGSNSRPTGYEPVELPLLYFAMWAAKIVSIWLSAKHYCSIRTLFKSFDFTGMTVSTTNIFVAGDQIKMTMTRQ